MMKLSRWILAVLVVYVALNLALGLLLQEGVVHPERQRLSDQQRARGREIAARTNSSISDVSIVTSDGIALQAWHFRPIQKNGDSVILVHGLGNNRSGMAGYAEMFLHHGYSVLGPDMRAHGESGGTMATYGLRESADLRLWQDWLASHDHPNRQYGMAESMGAAILLQSLSNDSRLSAAVAECSFSSFREIGYDRMAQKTHLPLWAARILLRPALEVAFAAAHRKYGLDFESIRPEEAAANSHVPILLIHGTADSNIPLRHSVRINEYARSHGAKIQLWEPEGAQHSSALGKYPQEFERRVFQFLKQEDAKIF